jgi:hypothetical protein
MANIKVDPQFLRSMAIDLGRMKGRFEGLDDDMEPYESDAVTGDDRVTAKLRDFGSNWRLTRTDMAMQMGQLAVHLVEAAGGYERTDSGVGGGFAAGRRGG